MPHRHSPPSPITRADIEPLVAHYRGVPPPLWPRWIRDPQNEFQFCVSVLVHVPEAWPIYDEHDVLTHFGGIALKQEPCDNCDREPAT
jgi:hypothetical protein